MVTPEEQRQVRFSTMFQENLLQLLQEKLASEFSCTSRPEDSQEQELRIP